MNSIQSPKFCKGSSQKWRQISAGTSLHGFRFLVGGSAFQRIFWFLSICLSAICMIYFILSTIDGFQTEPVTTNLETNSISWNNTFPSVSVCLVRGRSTTKVNNWLQGYWKRMNLPVSFKPISFYRLVQQYLFITHNNILDGGEINDELCDQYKDYEFGGTCGINLTALKNELLPTHCDEFMMNMKYLGQTVDCKSFFKGRNTEMGRCFTTNRLLDQETIANNFDTLSMKYSSAGHVERTISFDYLDLQFATPMLYIHSPNEWPDLQVNSRPLRKSAVHTFVGVNVIEMMNRPEVQMEPEERRKCRFPSEMINVITPYSVSNCFLKVRMEEELNSCNCTMAEFYGNPPQCTYYDLQCIRESSIPDKVRSNYCMPVCISMMIQEVAYVEENRKDTTKGSITIEVMSSPTVRYVRRVEKLRLDFIVALGSVFGLFFGGSLLSILELLYIIIAKKLQ